MTAEEIRKLEEEMEILIISLIEQDGDKYPEFFED